jgi:hypothetical protein
MSTYHSGHKKIKVFFIMHSLNSLKSKKIIAKADKQLRQVVISSSLSWNNMDAMAGQQTAHWDQICQNLY